MKNFLLSAKFAQQIALSLLIFLGASLSVNAQTTVFIDDFSTNSNATYSTSGVINSSAWSANVSGTDWGVRRNTSPQQLELTNDVGATANLAGWAFANVSTTAFSSPYNTTLSSNPSDVTWTFNMRTGRTTALSGFTATTTYGMAFIIGCTSNTPNTTGNGYAVVMGGGALNNIGFISFTNGLQGTKTTIIPYGLAPAALTNYMSLKLVYTKSTNTWTLSGRDDGPSAFVDPATGSFTLIGSAVNTTYTSTPLTLAGAYWQGSTGASQTSFFDNVKVSVATACTPPVLSLNTLTNVSCFGGNNGAIAINASGAASYLWSGPASFSATTQNISGLISGAYTVTATATGGCTASFSSTVTQPTAISFTATSNTPVCSGQTLQLNINSPSGGTGALSYSWSGPNSFSNPTQNPSITSVTTAAAGTYTATVTDASSCTKTNTTAVVINATPSVSISPASPSVCLGSGVALTASGATTYSWSPSGSLSAATGTTVTATPGSTTTYTVTGTTTGCSSTSTKTVTVNSHPTASCSATDATVANGSDGTATVLATSGSGTYTYSWTNSAQTTSTITGLLANSYTATVTDGNGCTATCTSVVGQPANALLANCSTVSNVSCNGGSNGSATAAPSGGTAPYTYSWSNAATTATISGLTAGNYIVTVTDAASTVVTCTVTISQPTAIVGSPTANSPLCVGSTLNLSSNASGGTGTLTYVWSGPNTFSSTSATPSISNVTSLANGAYIVTVTDANGCTKSSTVNVVVNTASISATATPATVCLGSSSSLVASGGVSYSWSPSTNLNITTGSTVISTPASNITYTVTGTDANSCVGTATVTVNVTAPTISISPASYTLLSGRSITLTSSGNTTSWSWTPGGATTSAITVSPTTTTTYSVTGTFSGCPATASVTVTVISTYAAGNLIVSRSGDGVAALTSSSTALFLDEYNVYTGSLVRTTAMPLSGSTRLTTAGNSGTESQITRSSTKSALVLAGYDAVDGLATVGTSTSAVAPRVVNTIDYAQNVIRAATTTSYSGTSFRSATSDGVSYWGAGGSGGTLLIGTSGAATAIQTSVGNSRIPRIFNGQLYLSTGAGTRGIYTIGTGLPTTSATALNMIALGTTASPEGFSVNSTTTVCYITDDAAFGIAKYTFNGTSWTLAYTLSTGIATRGLVVDYSGTNPILYATTSEAVSNRIIKIIDNGASATAVTMATAAANTAFRGITFAPECATANKPVITVDNIQNSCSGGSTGAVNITVTGASSPYAYTWSNGSTAEDPTGLAANTYTVTVMGNSGCSSFTSVTVGSIASPTTSISGNTAICPGGSTTLDAGAGFSSYSWSPGGATTQQITASAVGTYTVTVSNASGCTGTASVIVTQHVAPTPTISGNLFFCTGGSTILDAGAGYSSYLWSPGGATTQQLNVTSAGTYSVIISDGFGCTGSASVTVTLVAGLTPTITGATAYCQGSSTTLSAGVGYDTYSWTPGGATTSSIVVNAPGIYSVTVTSGSCSGTASVTVVENPTPTVSITPTSSTICLGQSTSLTASGATNYLWSPSTALNGTTTAMVVATPTLTITYTVVGTDNNSCTSSASVTVTVNSVPTVVVTPTQQAMCAGGSASISVSGANTYSWSPSTGLNTTTGNTVTSTTGATTVYTVIGTGVNGCTASASSTVIVIPSLAAPAVTSSYLYCQNAPATALNATPNPAYATLLWYTTPTGGTGSTTAPTPSTSTPGVQNYYVSQIDNSASVRIAINGMIDNGTPDLFSFVALSTIPVGTKIYFTDNGWTGSKFAGSVPLSNYKGTEDICKFTANVNIPAGTVIVSYSSSAFYSWTTSGLINTSAGASNNAYGQLSLATGGDQVYAFLSTSANDPLSNPTTFLFVLDDTYGFEAATSSNEGAIPPGLSIADGNAVTMSHNNYYYLVNDGYIRSATQWLQYAGDTLHYTRITGSNASLPALSTINYNVAAACEGPRANIQVTVQAAPVPDATVNSPVCAGGNINLSADPNYLYDVSWTGPNSFTSIGQTPVISGATLANAGNYIVTVTDFNGCSASQTVNVVVSQVVVNDSYAAIACNGGTTSVTVSATGGTAPYTGIGTFTVSAGTYTYTITDATGCIGTKTITITQPSAIAVTATETSPILCNGGTATVSVSATGGTGAYIGTGTFNPNAGTITYTVTDANGCTGSTSITIAQPSVIVVTATETTPIVCNGGTATVSVSATGGTGLYTGTGTFSANAGSHTYSVSDANSCSGSTTITVTEPPATTISSFTPISGCVGSTLTVYGQNFNSINAVDINGIVATFVIVSATEITVTVPAMATSGFITVTITANCSATTTSSFTITNCSTGMTINLKAYLQGYYIGGGMMQSVLLNQNIIGATTTQTDSIQVEIYDGTTFALAGSTKAVLMNDGTASAVINGADGNYYVAIRHRNSVLTWSSVPIALSSTTPVSYNFSTSPTQSFSGMAANDMLDGVYSIFTGDVNQDEFIDASDFPQFDTDNLSGACCSYLVTDFNGDGFVDASDFPVFDNNNLNGIFSIHP